MSASLLQATMDVRTAQFEDTLVRFSVETGRDIQDVIKQQARLVARTLVKVTPPFRTLNDMGENFTEQRRIGELAVSQEIGRAFKGIDSLSLFKNPREGEGSGRDAKGRFTTGNRLLKNLQGAITKGDTAALSIILQRSNIPNVNPDDVISEISPSLHNRLRNRRGKIPPSRRNSYWVLRDATVKAFIRKKQELVGRLKGGWAASCSALGVSLPNWITRHASGSFVDKSDDYLNPQMRLQNTVPYSNAADNDVRFVSIALRNQTGKMERQMEAKFAGAWSRSGGNH